MRCKLIMALLVFASVTNADEISELENRLELLTRRLEVQAAEAKFTAAELELANAEKTIATVRRDAAALQRDAEQIERTLGLPNIEVNRAWISVVRDPQRLCDATDFIRYTCHRSHSCPAFSVDQSICQVPGAESEPMILKINYSCDTDIRDQTIPFGQMAYISCK